MFGGENLDFARDQAIAIARERIAHISAENKTALLELIDAVLEGWKLEQASPDGTIEVWTRRSLLSDPLAEETKRLPAIDLKPEQCAGLFVRSAADLFAKLSAESYPAAVAIRDKAGYDTVISLLLERDGAAMPIDSIAIAVRSIWTWVWERGKAYREMLVEADQAKVDALAEARAASATKRTADKRMRDEDLRERARRLRKRDPSAKRFKVAADIRDELVAEGKSDAPEVATIEEALKGLFG